MEQMDVEGDPRHEERHPKVLRNEDPAFLGNLFGNVIVFFENYGWFVVIGIIIFLYLKTKLAPHVNKVKAKLEQATDSSATNPQQVWARQEAMDAHRRRLQEQHDAQAARYAEQQREREEQKRQQRIEDWDRHQQGKGYRSKYRPPDDPEPNIPDIPSGSRRPVYRPSDYNPLTGGGGGGGGFRPSRRSGGG